MKKITKNVLALLLCMTVTLSMCVCFADDSYAEAEGDPQLTAIAAEVAAAAEKAKTGKSMGRKKPRSSVLQNMFIIRSMRMIKVSTPKTT